MPEIKTRKNEASVEDFLASVAEGERLQDCQKLMSLMKKAAKAAPKMWGSAIIGFGAYKYVSGKKENEWPLIGFSPRKNSLVVYIMPGFTEYATLMKKLGKCKTGKSCLYLNSLAEVDTNVLGELISKSVAAMKAKHGQ